MELYMMPPLPRCVPGNRPGPVFGLAGLVNMEVPESLKDCHNILGYTNMEVCEIPFVLEWSLTWKCLRVYEALIQTMVCLYMDVCKRNSCICSLCAGHPDLCDCCAVIF